MLVAKLDRLSHDVHFISGLMSVTHLIETTAKLRMPHPSQRTRCCTSRTLSRGRGQACNGKSTCPWGEVLARVVSRV